MMLKVRALWSFEATFVLFVFAGLYKGDPVLQKAPVDLTAFFFCLSVASAIALLARDQRLARTAIVLIVLFTAFASWCAISVLWSPGHDYALSKLGRIGVLTLWSMAGPALIISRSTERARRFMRLTIAFAAWVGIQAIIAYSHSAASTAVSVLGGTYLGIARLFGIALILLIAEALLFQQRVALRFVAMLGAVAAVGLLLIVGGRGPLLSAGVTLLIPVSLGTRLSRAGIAKARRFALRTGLFVGGAFTFAAFLTLTGSHARTITRLMLILNGQMGDSASTRISLWKEALELWASSPVFGIGLGGFPILTGMGDVRAYPHNIVLEVMSELGLVGLLLLAGLFAYGVRCLGPLRQLRNDPWRILLLMLVVNSVLNALVSGDIHDNRHIFTMLGLCPLAALSMNAGRLNNVPLQARTQ